MAKKKPTFVRPVELRPTTLRVVQEMLPCRLTDDESRLRGVDLARAMRDVDDEEDTQETIKSQMKARLGELGAKVSRLADVVRSGVEQRSVQTEDQADYKTGKVDTVRLDTGEIIRTRDLTEAERQIPLPTGDEPPKA